MRSNRPVPKTIDEYIWGFSVDVQLILEKIRRTIRKAAPDVEESISYQIPAFKLNGKPLLFFAAYKKHIGLYPAPRTAEEFKEELAAFDGGKGTVRFPLGAPIPYDLIRRIAKFRLKTLLESAPAKSVKKK
ncbi:MAG: iron chaperone [Blastocatellia bacterium]